MAKGKSGFDTKAIDDLLRKLNNYSNIETKEAVEYVAKEMNQALKSACPKDEGNSKESINICEVREYPTATYIDVGLRQDNVPFEKWRGAWFNEWGWSSGGKMHTPHIGWFRNTTEAKAKEVTKYLKDKLKEQEKEFNK